MPTLAVLLILALPAASAVFQLEKEREKAWLLMQNDLPEATAAWERVADEAGRAGDRNLQALAYYDLAILAEKDADPARARAFYEKALDLHEKLLFNVRIPEFDMPYWNFERLCPGNGPAKDAGEASCLRRKQDFRRRRRELYETEASMLTESSLELVAQAETANLQGRLAEAAALLRRATDASDFSSAQKASAAIRLAEVELRLGRTDEAADALYRAWEAMRSASAPRADWLRLGRGFLKAGEWRAAAQAYASSIRAFQEGPSDKGCPASMSPAERTYCLSAAAAAAGQKRDILQEFALLRRAIAVSSAAQDWGREVQARQQLARQFCLLNIHEDCAAAMELVVRRAAATGQRAAQAESLLAAAKARYELSEFPEGRARAAEAREIYLALPDETGAHTALHALAAGALHAGDVDEGVRLLDEVISDDLRRGLDRKVVMHFAERSDVRRHLGDFSGSMADARWILELGLRDKDAGLTRDGHRLVASAFGYLGDDEAALVEAEKSVALARGLKDKDGLANALNEKGIVEMNLALYDKSFVEAAIADLKESFSLWHWNGTLVNLGDAYWAAGRIDEADRQWERARHRLGRSSVLHAKGRYKEALEANRAMLAGFERGKDYNGLMFVLTQLGQNYEALGRFDEAAAFYGRARSVQEEVRDSLSEGDRLHFLAGNDWQIFRLEALEGLVRVLDRTAAGSAGAFAAAEYTRSRVFAEAAARRFDAPEARLPAETAREESRLIAGMAETAKRRASALRAGNSVAYVKEDDELKRLRGVQAGLVERLRARFPEYAAAVYPKPVAAAAVPLRADEALIEFEVTAPYTKAFVVRGGKVVLTYEVRATRQELSDLVARYTGYFDGVAGSDELAAFDGALSHQLYRLLLERALKTLPAGTKVIIAPDESLAMLPFESLASRLPERLQSPAGKHGPAPLGLRYAADDWDIAYTQSATALAVSRAPRKRSPARKPLLVVADPVFSASDARSRAGASSGGPELTLAVLKRMGLAGGRAGASTRKVVGEEEGSFPRLDGTSVLAERLLGRVFSGAGAEALVGWNARLSELRSRRLSDYRYLVFATHGILDGEVPMLREPALVLTQLGLKTGETGFLTMSEVLGLRLSADLVALTACRTGVGRRRMGEGVMGLGRAFQLAGARAALVSLWSVSEASTTFFAERLFVRLREGKSPREAQRLARAELRREGYEHPFFWAPFVLYTD